MLKNIAMLKVMCIDNESELLQETCCILFSTNGIVHQSIP